jgi:hypothetical protein
MLRWFCLKSGLWFVFGRRHRVALHGDMPPMSEKSSERLVPLHTSRSVMIHCSPFCAGMDSQIDVALYTLVQMAPPALYYHFKVVEDLLWEPWRQPYDADFAVMLMVRPPCLTLTLAWHSNDNNFGQSQRVYHN